MTEPILGTVTFKLDSEGNPSFNAWEHLQSLLKKQHNRLVANYFADVTAIDFNSLSNRASLKFGCWMQDTDSTIIFVLRLWLFYIVTGHLKGVTEPYFGIPIEELEAVRKYRPQVILVFKEDSEDVEDGYRPVRGRIAYRLMDEESESLTESDLLTMASAIKEEFGGDDGLTWRKGKDMATYVDKGNGHDFHMLCRSESEAKSLIESVLAIESKEPDWSKLQYKVNSEAATAYPTLPPEQTILGKEYREARRRPLATVRFQYAQIRIWGISRPIVLYDRSFTYADAMLTD